MPHDLLPKLRSSARWLPSYLWQQIECERTKIRRLHKPYLNGARCASGETAAQSSSRKVAKAAGARHLIFALADHYEPSFSFEPTQDFVDYSEQEKRVERWCKAYPKAFERWRDADGQAFRHTYFYPAEQYDKALIERLAKHCADGWGEIEIQLHHGVSKPDSSENTRRVLLEFRDKLVAHGCLARWDGMGAARFAFVHGNWALANSAGGACCGVDDEMQILAEAGCYADMTLPSAPHDSQVGKINALYECALPLHENAPHRRGRDLSCGEPPQQFPIIVQGPLGLDFSLRCTIGGLPLPCIENSELSTRHPPTLERLRLWQNAAITVQGNPDWLFIKLQCHGMDPRDEAAMLGALQKIFLQRLTEDARVNHYAVHFTTAREMVNIILAACDGREGKPGDFRNYRLQPVTATN